MKFKVTLVDGCNEKEILIIDGEYIDFSSGYVIIGNNAFSNKLVQSVVDVTDYVYENLHTKICYLKESVKNFALDNGCETTIKEFDRIADDFEASLS